MSRSWSIALAALLCVAAACAKNRPIPPGQTDTGGPADVGGASDMVEDVVRDQAVDMPALVCGDTTGLTLYRDLIEPLIDEQRPSSCTQCHLQGTSLHRFIRPGDPCQSMACLVDEKLVDLEVPEDSLILSWIDRANEVSDSQVFRDRVIKPEYEAMMQWIQYSSSCQAEACPTYEDPCEKNPVVSDAGGDDVDAGTVDMCDKESCAPPPELTMENYECTEDGIAAAMYDHVFPWHGRCAHCHTPDSPLGDVSTLR